MAAEFSNSDLVACALPELLRRYEAVKAELREAKARLAGLDK